MINILSTHTFNSTLLLALLLGCGQAHSPCGDGTSIEFGGSTYCVYRTGLFEECAEDFPNQYDYGEFQACGEASSAPEGLEEEIARELSSEAGLDDSGLAADSKAPPHDGGFDLEDTSTGETCEYHSMTFQLGDKFCDIEGCNFCQCERGDRSICSTIGCAPHLDAGGDCARTLWHGESQSGEAITLGIFADGTFRWTAISCDSSRGDVGFWRKTNPDLYLELLPARGQTEFGWPDGTRHERLTVPADPKNTEDALNVRISEQKTDSWQAGGECPVCEGDSMTKEACLNPYAY